MSTQAQTCPVCGGNGLVPNGFYNQTSGQWLFSSTAPETCRTCNGSGVVHVTQTNQTVFYRNQ
jgi:DnaJ-class molecular chaperone